ncbi:enterobactin exporter EntS [bacterium BMS3Abin02]|nr:enterobactin exporter EntS [bacterium BMS3Abin02]GBE23434.1 enterobactin exporter EntS [bacterium BMS3Bbin01]HDK46087.1 MFS transporter [Actinomycetota bacterium]HDL49029.1 MFS transporter [Actinomycetota bacterium]
MRTFFIVWSGQLVSIVGSSLTGFALSIWVYQQSGSVTMLALVMLAATVPGVLVAPFAGALVDRWDRRLVMLGGDGAAGMATGVVALLLVLGQLHLLWIFALVIVGSVANAFQEPAWTASVPMLVPKKHLGRANGLAQTGQAVGNLLAPAIAGALLGIFGLWGVLLVDFVTFLVAVGTVSAVRIPRPERTAGVRSVQKEAAEGWRYLRARPGLFALLGVMAVINFQFGFASVLFIPLFLSFTNEVILGSMMSIAGFGMLLGTVVMSAWGGPRRRIAGLAILISVAGLALSATGVRAAVLPATIGMSGLFFLVPIVNGTSQALWQTKVHLDMQGRVFALRRMMAQIAAPASYLLAGPLADRVFEPLMRGPLASSVGSVIGVGDGRGIGLLFIVMGLSLSITMGVAYAMPRVRRLESEIPDVVEEAVPVGEIVTLAAPTS